MVDRVGLVQREGLGALEFSHDPFDSYVARYRKRSDSYLTEVEKLGLPFAEPDDRAACVKLSAIGGCGSGIHVENNGCSLWRGSISPACLACRKGLRTATFIISTQCPKNCWFCFNRNQSHDVKLRSSINDAAGELEEYWAKGVIFEDLALTGGEPLLHKSETLRFLETARKLYPRAYTRLYTAGSYLDEECALALGRAGLDELRVGIKTDETAEAIDEAIALLSMAQLHIPHVLVEMPVMPDELLLMENLLVRLDEVGIDGVNLLELCFPLHRADEYVRRDYRLKNPPFRVLYEYWYAGGMPVAGSEEACLRLLKFAEAEKLRLGVHYCSFENKVTSQVYLQNKPYGNDGIRFMDPKDHFLKSVKAFSSSFVEIASWLAREGVVHDIDEADGCVEFLPTYAFAVKRVFPDVRMLVCFYVAERREGCYLLEEVEVKDWEFLQGAKD